MQDNKFKQAILESIRDALGEELNRQEQLSDFAYDSLSKLDKDDLDIISVTPSNKSDKAIVVRFNDKDSIDRARTAIRKAVKRSGISVRDRVIPKYDPSIECTEVSYGDGSGRIYIVYKYDIGSREGLALEHVVGLMLTGKVTDELKNRLNLPPEATKEEVKEKLKTDFSHILHIAIQGKNMIVDRIGKVESAESEGSRNSKADLILTNESGDKYGLSVKLVTEEGREIRFTYNKNIGYGDEKEDNLVKNPSGEPWWIVGRKAFADKLNRKYNPDRDNLEPPSWMTKAKEDHPDLYKEAMSETYEKMREIFVNNLRHMKLKELVKMVNEAQLGADDERNGYKELLVLISDVDGVRLEDKKSKVPDISTIKTSGIDKTDIVQTDGARIMIAIPGMDELTIHGLKFHSNMLSSNREDLKIKTR